MKKWIVFLFGLVTGVVLTILTCFIVVKVNDGPSQGVRYSDNQTVFRGVKEFVIFQVAPDGALAYYDSDGDGAHGLLNSIVFLLNIPGKQFYDGMRINVAENEKVMMVGTFRYDTEVQNGRVVPAVEIQK